MKKITTEEILNTACALFREKGFDETSLDEVCRACGISKPTFYKYLPGKDAILIDYYDQVCRDIMVHFSNVYQMDTFYEQFHLFYDIIIDRSIYLGPELISRMLRLNLEKDSSSFSAREELTKIVLYLIQKGQKAGEFKSEVDARSLYDSVNFIFLGLELKWCIKKGNFDWKSEFLRLSDSILQGEK